MIIEGIKHYKSVQFSHNQYTDTYSVGDKVWVLDGGKREQKFIIDIFDGKPFEDSDYVTKCCYVSDNQYTKQKSFVRLEECYHDDYDVEKAEQRWKDEYDDYVTLGRI